MRRNYERRRQKCCEKTRIENVAIKTNTDGHRKNVYVKKFYDMKNIHLAKLNT